MIVQQSEIADVRSWLRLADDARQLFGSIVSENGFQALLRRAIQGEEAFCVREDDQPPGVPLCGGILISYEENRISFLAVARAWRRRGIGESLVDHALTELDPNRPVIVTTFAEDVPGSAGARSLYWKFGFRPVEQRSGGHGHRKTEDFIRPLGLRRDRF